MQNLRPRGLSLPAILLLAATAGCWAPVSKADRDRVSYPTDEDGVLNQPSAFGEFPYDPGEREILLESGLADEDSELGRRLDSFALQLSAGARDAGSVGCFPAVTYEIEAADPYVSALGEALAIATADRLTGQGQAWVLGPSDLAVRADQSNVPREALATLSAAQERGPRLGVDLVVFGAIQRRENPAGRANYSELDVKLTGYDVLAGRVVQELSFRVPSNANRQLWDLANRDGTWLPESGAWSIPRPEPTFAKEVATLNRMLAMRAVQALGGRAQGATLYIPPLDTRRFVGAVAELRSMQSAFASEYARRAEQADSTGIEFDTFSPMVLNGVEYRDLQQAEDALHRYREGLLAGPAMRFAQGMSQNFAAELMPLLSGSDVLVNDLGSTKWSDTALIEGELALGGLARSLVARSTLRDDGIDYVLAPRIDTLGSAYQLRLDIYDLGRGAVLATTYVLVDEAFSAELEGELGAQTGLEPIELPKVGARLETPGAWTAVYDEAVDGVVLIVDLESGRGGTGFVVDSSGLVMTNSHVVEGMSDQTIALWRDGTERSLELLVRDVDQDLAVLRLDSPAAGMHVFELADPTEAAVGLEVAVIGHPKDARESGWSSSGWVMSPGYLSSVSERVTMPSGRERLSYMYTCPTRKGNSGSPVLSRAGRVVAVNSHGTAGDLYAAGGELADAADSGAILTELPGFSKGAPANEARRVLEEARLLR